MSYRLLASVYDWVAPHVSRYRSPRLLTAKVLELAPDACELLDIGAGTGLSIAPYVNSPRFKRIVGVDPSAEMLSRCRRKFASVELHQGTLEAVHADLGSPFDIVQSCGAVEHIPDLAPFMGRVATLLKPRGHFVFTYEPEMLFSIRQSPNTPHIGTFGRERVFRRTPHDVQATLRRVGLTACEDLEFTAYLGLVHHLVIARKLPNLFEHIPPAASEERVDVLVDAPGLRLERIVSTGQATPPGQWYDQDTDEWVLVLRGRGGIRFEDSPDIVALRPGDHLLIPAHRRHRVEWTAPDQPTVWLALHYRA